MFPRDLAVQGPVPVAGDPFGVLYSPIAIHAFIDRTTEFNKIITELKHATASDQRG